MTQLPWNEDAEQQLLGAIILDNGRAKSAAMHQCVPSDFFSQAHQIIFEAMQSLADCGDAIDLVTLPNKLQENGNALITGGDDYIFELATKCGVPGHFQDYIKIVKDDALARRIVKEVTDAVETSDAELIAAMATKLGIDHSIAPIKSICIADAKDEEEEYVYDPFFPRRQVTDLSGPENAGKTRFLIAFLSWLSIGFNPRGGGHPVASVMMITTEDTAGALKKVIAEYGGTETCFHVVAEAGPLSSGVMSSIAAEARRLKVDMVVFDPIMEYLPPHVASQEFSQPIIQQFIKEQKRRIAVAANVSVVNIRHFSKSSEKSSDKGGSAHGQKGSGSRAWTTKARSGLEFERPPFESGVEAHAVIRHTRGSINRGHGGRFIFFPYRYKEPFDFTTDPSEIRSKWDEAILEYLSSEGGSCLYGKLINDMKRMGLEEEQFKSIVNGLKFMKRVTIEKDEREKAWVSIAGGE